MGPKQVGAKRGKHGTKGAKKGTKESFGLRRFVYKKDEKCIHINVLRKVSTALLNTFYVILDFSLAKIVYNADIFQ